jgi:hypothetical protein
MTPQEKAKELVDRYLDIDDYNNLELDLFCDECGMSNDAAKICSLIAVDEVINTELLKNRTCGYVEINKSNIEYWLEVRNEIQKL